MAGRHEQLVKFIAQSVDGHPAGGYPEAGGEPQSGCPRQGGENEKSEDKILPGVAGLVINEAAAWRHGLRQSGKIEERLESLAKMYETKRVKKDKKETKKKDNEKEKD